MSKRMRRGGIVAAVAAAFLAVCVMVTSAWAVTGIQYADKPANGTTQGQPFAPGTGGSQNFRIPGIVTLNDGTIVACTDARWNHAGDGAGLDTIVSVSKDGGENWTYTFANYLGDNGNEKNVQSTAFIDPAIATDGETVYLVADLFPAGLDLNTAASRPVAGKTGFTDDGTGLILRENDHTPIDGSYGATVAAKAYDYYLNLEDLTIHRSDGTLVEGYEVDAYFNITETETGDKSNLFCADAPFQVYPTDYLYMTSSEDGLNWSEPTLINLKEAEEQVLLVGPGNGIVLDDGTLVFSVYEFTSGKSSSGQEAGIIWRDDASEWHRSASVADCGVHWTSEATAVQIDDTTIRQFVRDGSTAITYVDYTLTNDVWVPGEIVSTDGVKTTNNQLSAIKYSKQIDGKDAIILSTAASGSASRSGGKLYVGLLDEANHIDWQYAYPVVEPGGYYAYSCLTELSDGSVGLLYESAGAQETFVVIPYEDLVGDKTNTDYAHQAVEIDEDESVTVNDPSGDFSSESGEGIDTNIATVEISSGPQNDTTAVPGSTSAEGQYDGAPVDLSKCLYTFAPNDDGTYVVSATAADGSTVYLDPSKGTGTPHDTTAENMNVVIPGALENTVYLRSTTASSNGGYYLYFDKAANNLNRVDNLNNNQTWMSNCSAMLYRPVADGDVSSAEIPGYVQVTEFNDLSGQYLIVFLANNGTYYTLYPTMTAGSKTAQAAQITAGGPSTNITFTAVAPGNTGVVIGNTYYDVTVNKVYDLIPSTDITATAGSEVSDGNASATEGKIGFAFDNKTNTYWHSSWTATTMDNLWVTMELQQATSVESLQYLPRQTSSSNGTVTEATIQCSNDGETWHDITTVEWPNSGNKDWRIVDFETPIIARYFRLQGVHTYADSGNDQFMSAAEIRLAKGPEVDQSALNAALSKAEDLVEEDYTPESWAAFEEALAAANEALFIADTETANAAAQALETAITSLVSAGQPEITGDNVALHKTAVSKTNEGDNVISNNVTDGDTTTTRWASAVNDKPTWIYVDLNGTYDVSAVKLFWQNRKALDYSIQVAAEGADLDSEGSWTTIQHEQNMPEETTETFIFNEAKSARYVRILITDFQAQNPDDPSKSWNNVSLYEVEVYGTESAPAPEAPDQDSVFGPNGEGIQISYNCTTEGALHKASGTASKNFISSGNFTWGEMSYDSESQTWSVEVTLDPSEMLEDYFGVAHEAEDVTLTLKHENNKWCIQSDEENYVLTLTGSCTPEVPEVDGNTCKNFAVTVYTSNEDGTAHVLRSSKWNNVDSDIEISIADDPVKTGDGVWTIDATVSVGTFVKNDFPEYQLLDADAKTITLEYDVESQKWVAPSSGITTGDEDDIALFGAAFELAKPYGEDNRFFFPSDVDESAVLEFELGIFDDDESNDDGNDGNTWPMVVINQNGERAVDAVRDGDFIDVPFTADVAGTYEVVLSYASGSASNGLSWSDKKGLVASGSETAGADAATELHTVTFNMTVDEAGSSTLSFGAKDSAGAPRLDKLTITLKEAAPETHTVTFVVPEGVTAPEAKPVANGDKVTKPTDPTRTGYIFLGWYTKSSQGTPKRYDFTTPVTSDLALVAGWEFKAPNAELSVSPENPVEGDTVTITVTATHDLGDGVNYTYYWTHNGELIYGEYDSTLEVTEPGRYGVFVNATDKSNPNAHYMTGESIEVTFAPKPVDFSALAAAIADGTAINTEGKTQDSADALRDALVVGEALLENPEATQEQVDDAAQAIRDAIANLEDEPDQGGQPGTGEEPGTGEQPGDDQQGGSQQPGGNQKPGDTTKPGTGGSTVGGASEPSGDGLAQTGDPATMAAALATALTGVAAVAAATKARRMK